MSSGGGGKCIRHNHAPDPENWRTSCLSASPMRDASRKDADSCSNAAPRIFETAAAGIRRGLTNCDLSAPARKIFSAGLPPRTPPGMNSHLSTAVHTWKTHRIWATCLGDPRPLADDHDVGRDTPCGGLPAQTSTNHRGSSDKSSKSTHARDIHTRHTGATCHLPYTKDYSHDTPVNVVS